MDVYMNQRIGGNPIEPNASYISYAEQMPNCASEERRMPTPLPANNGMRPYSQSEDACHYSIEQERYKQEMQRKVDEAWIRVNEEAMKSEIRKEESTHKAYLAKEREDRIFERRRRSEMEQKKVFQDSQGYLRLQSMIPQERDIFSNPVFPFKRLRLINIVSTSEILKVQQVLWDGLQEDIYLIGKNCSVKGFSEALKKFGISIGFGRDKKRMVEEKIYQYLLENAENRLMLPCYGWHKAKDDEWHFAHDEMNTVQGIVKKFGQECG